MTGSELAITTQRSQSPYGYSLQITIQCLAVQQQSNVSKETANKLETLLCHSINPWQAFILDAIPSSHFLCTQKDIASIQQVTKLTWTCQLGERDQGGGDE